MPMDQLANKTQFGHMYCSSCDIISEYILLTWVAGFGGGGVWWQSDTKVAKLPVPNGSSSRDKVIFIPSLK